MARVLVVDDSPLDLRLAARLLEEAGYVVDTAIDGQQALEILSGSTSLPDVVLTDIQMPRLNGLELVRQVARRCPGLPVVIMTGCGSEETAVEALRSGAASYLPKVNLTRDLAGTLKTVQSVAKEQREAEVVLESLTRWQAEYVLGNRIDSVSALVNHLKGLLRRFKLLSEGDLLRVGTALYEALVNAIEHGNLELDSALRESATSRYFQLFEERNQLTPYRERQVRLQVSCSRHELVFQIRDEGPGFDPSQLPDPTSPANVEKTNGRGLFLIRTFMDRVEFNDLGNEITMVKRCREGNA